MNTSDGLTITAANNENNFSGMVKPILKSSNVRFCFKNCCSYSAEISIVSELSIRLLTVPL